MKKHIVKSALLITTIKALFLLSCVNLKKGTMKITNHYNYQVKIGEVNDSPSLTIQGEAYSIEELMKKNASGINIELQQKAYYDEEPDHGDVDMNKAKDLDLVDKQTLLRRAKKAQKEAKEVVQKRSTEVEGKEEKNEEIDDSKKDAVQE